MARTASVAAAIQKSRNPADFGDNGTALLLESYIKEILSIARVRLMSALCRQIA